MASEAEIKAAAKAIRKVEDPLEFDWEFEAAARAALEAAERVRAFDELPVISKGLCSRTGRPSPSDPLK